ncbi:MAG: hypothetical protein ACT4PS_15630 [Betaproteobacteria bacterium]
MNSGRDPAPYLEGAGIPSAQVLPDLPDGPAPMVIRLDTARGVALFPGGVEVPLAPFMGIIAVAPPFPRVSAQARGE